MTGSLSAQYRHPCGAVARVEWLVTGRTFFDDANTEYGAQHSYGILNAKVGFEKGNWSLFVYGRNLADTDYYSLKIPALNVGFPGEPRTFGVVARWAF